MKKPQVGNRRSNLAKASTAFQCVITLLRNGVAIGFVLALGRTTCAHLNPRCPSEKTARAILSTSKAVALLRELLERWRSGLAARKAPHSIRLRFMLISPTLLHCIHLLLTLLPQNNFLSETLRVPAASPQNHLNIQFIWSGPAHRTNYTSSITSLVRESSL